MKSNLCFYLFIISVLLMGCRNESQTKLLSEAEAFLPANPDSAKSRLEIVEAHHLGNEEDEARYALLCTVTDA